MLEGPSSKLGPHLYTNYLVMKSFCTTKSRDKTKMEKFTHQSGLKSQMKIVFLKVKNFY